MKNLKDKIINAYQQHKLKDFLNIILTESEIKNIEERMQIIHLLLEGKTQREIAKQLNISITTVTRGNKVLEKHKKDCAKIFNPN